MGRLHLKKLSLFFLIVSASVLLPATFAGGRSRFAVDLGAVEESEIDEGMPKKPSEEREEATSIHERLLRMNTGDYGRYSPSPALKKPRSKLIPNCN